MITEAALVAVKDGARTGPLIVLLEELLMFRVFDVPGVEVDVTDVSDVSQSSPGGVQLVDVCQVWLGGVPLPQTPVDLLPRDQRAVDDVDLPVGILDVEDDLLLGDDVLLPHLPLLQATLTTLTVLS